MTREDVKKIFPNASDEEITAILNQHNSEVNTAKSGNIKADELKALREKAEKYDDYEKQKLTLDEQAKLALEDAEKAKSENLRLLNRTKVISEFAGAGLKEDDYKGIIDTIVSEDEETSVNSAKSIVSMLASQKKSVEDNLKESVLKNTPHPGGSNTDKGQGDDKLSEAEKLAVNLAKSRTSAGKAAADGLKNYLGG
ncbi:MAG: hypothetical protein Q4E74_10870 [Ruminococcus sp.]|nr:hypothetical protein [Ruminococcus sp.]